jgi:hypothetical protein
VTQVIEVHTETVVYAVPTRTLIEVGTPGPQGPAGTAGGSAFTHVQSAPSTSWTINHGFGREPAITIVIGSEEVSADVNHPTVNTAVINFGTPQTGKAVLI